TGWAVALSRPPLSFNSRVSHQVVFALGQVGRQGDERAEPARAHLQPQWLPLTVKLLRLAKAAVGAALGWVRADQCDVRFGYLALGLSLEQPLLRGQV